MKIIYKRRVKDIAVQIVDAITQAQVDGKEISTIFLDRDEWESFRDFLRGLGGMHFYKPKYLGGYEYHFMGISVRPRPSVKAQLEKEWKEEVNRIQGEVHGMYPWQMVWREHKPTDD